MVSVYYTSNLAKFQINMEIDQLNYRDNFVQSLEFDYPRLNFINVISNQKRLEWFRISKVGGS